MAKKNTDGKWEIYNVTYLLPLFGSEGEFQKNEQHMMISTQGGPSDARAAVQQYHKGCKIVSVLDRLADIANQDGYVSRVIKSTSKK